MSLSIDASFGYNLIISGRRMSRMYRKDTKDMIGKVIGRLTVIKKVHTPGKRGSRWECMCSCGNITIAEGGHLRYGQRISCGCTVEDNIERTGVNRLISIYKRKSLLKKREFSLTFDQFKGLILSNCFYCGINPRQILRRLKSDKVQIIYNGIDRKDPSLGYIEANCVSACKYCNQAKSDLSVGQFRDHIERIHRWLSIGS